MRQQRAAHRVVPSTEKSVAAKMDLNDVICVSSRTVVFRQAADERVPTERCASPQGGIQARRRRDRGCAVRRLHATATSRSRRSTRAGRGWPESRPPFRRRQGRPAGMLPTRRPSRALPTGDSTDTNPTAGSASAGNTGSACFAGRSGCPQQDLRIHRHDVGCHLARRHERRGVEHVFDNADLLVTRHRVHRGGAGSGGGHGPVQ